MGKVTIKKTAVGVGIETPKPDYSSLYVEDDKLLLHDGDSDNVIDFTSGEAPAGEGVAGILEIATQAEVDAGTNDTKAITPLKLNAAPIQQATTILKGGARLATQDEVDTGTNNETIVTPLTLANTDDTVSSVHGRTGNVVGEAGDYDKTQVGLSNVDDVADVDKPVSNAQQTALDLKQNISEKGLANGYTPLDGSMLVDVQYIPPLGRINQGDWNANTNTPFLQDSGVGGTEGQYYRVSVAGTTLIDGINTWSVNDLILNTGSVWVRILNESTVLSIHGRIGDVVGQAGDYTKADVGLANVDNVADANKPVSISQQTALDLKEDLVNKGQANGYTPLDGSTLVGNSYLPDATNVEKGVSRLATQTEVNTGTDVDTIVTPATLLDSDLMRLVNIVHYPSKPLYVGSSYTADSVTFFDTVGDINFDGAMDNATIFIVGNVTETTSFDTTGSTGLSIYVSDDKTWNVGGVGNTVILGTSTSTEPLELDGEGLIEVGNNGTLELNDAFIHSMILHLSVNSNVNMTDSDMINCDVKATANTGATFTLTRSHMHYCLVQPTGKVGELILDDASQLNFCKLEMPVTYNDLTLVSTIFTCVIGHPTDPENYAIQTDTIGIADVRIFNTILHGVTAPLDPLVTLKSGNNSNIYDDMTLVVV